MRNVRQGLGSVRAETGRCHPGFRAAEKAGSFLQSLKRASLGDGTVVGFPLATKENPPKIRDLVFYMAERVAASAMIHIASYPLKSV